MAQIVERLPTVGEYISLRRAVDWQVPDVDAVDAALERSAWAAVAEEGGEVVGMGRIVGDTAFYSLVVDLVVAPSHQRQGVGARLLETLERHVATNSVTGSVQLVAGADVSEFYEALGYRRSSSHLLAKRVG